MRQNFTSVPTTATFGLYTRLTAPLHGNIGWVSMLKVKTSSRRRRSIIINFSLVLMMEISTAWIKIRENRNGYLWRPIGLVHHHVLPITLAWFSLDWNSACGRSRVELLH